MEKRTPSRASHGVENPPYHSKARKRVVNSFPQRSGAASVGASRLRWIVLGAAAIVAFLYFVPIPFIAYTSDAYVRSDFVEVAPQVSGVVKHVDVANDQKVAVGDLLAPLDPEPFALGVDLDQTRLDGAAAAAKVKEEDARVLASALETAKAAVTLAQQDYDRVATLVQQGADAEAVLDRSVDDRQKTPDAVTGVEARLRVNAGEVASTLAEVAVAKAQLAIAQYNLARTRLVAPVPGFVILLAMRRGAAWVAVNRVAGCVLGGAYGLLSMRFVGDAFAVWIALLFGGLYVSCYVKERDGEASYTGHQAAVAVIMSMVQGLAPSPDIMPAIERLAGMIGGIAVVMVAQAAATPLVSSAISAILGSGRDAMRDPRPSGEGERRGVPRGGDLA